jgi:hypothetical protein
MNDPINCERQLTLTWYAVASQLKTEGLNYLESLKLARDHIAEWEPIPDGTGARTAIDCENFVQWMRKNKVEIIKYKNSIHSMDPVGEAHIKDMEARLGYSRKRPK